MLNRNGRGAAISNPTQYENGRGQSLFFVRLTSAVMMGIWLVFVLAAALKPGNAQTQQECDYEHDVRMYICRNVRDVFPNKFYGNYHLQCVDCNIGKFTNKTFPYTNSLLSFNVSDSGIEYVDSRALSSLTNAQHLYLQDNEIREIAPGAFAGLRQVYELHLENNDIVTLLVGFLDDLEVNTVNLRNNKIRELFRDNFAGALNVLILDLSHNKIKKLHQDVFAGLDSLEVLNLEHNQFCHLPLGIFKELGTLRQLNLADNKLVRFAIGTFSGLKNLNSLNLANNTIGVFDGNILLPIARLSKLDISGNGIYYFDAITIHTNAPTVRVLRMDDNLFSCSLLINIMQYFKSVNVEVINSVGRFGVQNVNGIACTEVNIKERVDFNAFLQVAAQDSEKYVSFC